MNKRNMLMVLSFMLPGAVLYGMDMQTDAPAAQAPMSTEMKQEYQQKKAVLDGQIQEFWNFLNQAGPGMEKELIESGCDANEALEIIEGLQIALAKTHVRLVRLDARINDQK